MASDTWYTIGRSVRGEAHFRARLPNQDALGWWPERGTGPPLVVAVADGHGSARSFRSDRGAAFAITVATEELPVFLDAVSSGGMNLSAVKRLAEERLPRALVRAWKHRVDADRLERPITEEEWSRLEEREGAAACRAAVRDRPYLAYGATLLTVVMHEAFVLYLQLGDGDILTVSETCDVVRPLPPDERLLANDTTSLCGDDAWADVRVRFQAQPDPPPAVVLLATDGYANSFRSDAGFLTVGRDFLQMLREDGVEQVERHLEGWLRETTQGGSGDDITVALLCRTDVLHHHPGPIAVAAAGETEGVLATPDEALCSAELPASADPRVAQCTQRYPSGRPTLLPRRRRSSGRPGGASRAPRNKRPRTPGRNRSRIRRTRGRHGR